MNPRLLAVLLLATAAASPAELKLRLTWGNRSPAAASFYVKLVPAGVEIPHTGGYLLESGEAPKDGAWQTRAGGGDVDGVDFTLSYPDEPVRMIQDLHIIWADLIAHSDADTARRHTLDPAFRLDSRKLTVQLNAEGTRGFTVTVDQILQNRSFWVPSLDLFLTSGETSLEEYQKGLGSRQGRRILGQIRRQPEAKYDEYASRWEDLGSPAYVNPSQRGPGHMICITWDSALPKFGIDRGAGVWNDYGNPDHFRFWFGFADLAQGIVPAWRSQRLQEGLPVITTVLEQDGVRYEVEQFAYPLDGPPPERRGDIGMVLLQKVRMTDLLGAAPVIPVTLNHLRELPRYVNADVVLEQRGNAFLLEDSGRRDALLSVEGLESAPALSGVRDYQREMRRANLTAFVSLPAGGAREMVVKLPSPAVSQAKAGTLVDIDYAAARTATVGFWTRWLARGAQFRSPERIVNDLYRANLWHALRLPRRHGAGGPGVEIDLPYSNFAYAQTGTPWPVNQAVYVDYMIYDLRGFHDVSAEELAAIFHHNQEADGRLNGVANWLVYTPGMLYAVAQQYLLSGDRAALERLLPTALKSLDWCLGQIRRSGGLVNGPLNDGTGSGVWAFNQAYLFAGLKLFGRALEQVGHPRARESLEGARTIRQAIDTGFHAAAMRSPLVQLRDHTWVPYVPSEARTFGRIFSQWYPTDVDTGALHMVRLDAVPPGGDLADSLLNDHEDNLFLKSWGMANEPVYNQQATAYLLRDDPEAVVRAFYSFMASAFSHSALEPVEHRWTHGQYFGPPSTDGAWADVYRHMLIHERDDDTLLLGQAAPRAWLEDGKRIEVERAPTYYGRMSFVIESGASRNRITGRIDMPERRAPKALLVRFRHPAARPMRSVTMNGRDWNDFDASKEWVRIANPGERKYEVIARY